MHFFIIITSSKILSKESKDQEPNIFIYFLVGCEGFAKYNLVIVTAFEKQSWKKKLKNWINQ